MTSTKPNKDEPQVTMWYCECGAVRHGRDKHTCEYTKTPENTSDAIPTLAETVAEKLDAYVPNQGEYIEFRVGVSGYPGVYLRHTYLQATVSYYPNAATPRWLIVVHQAGVAVLDYFAVEYAYPEKERDAT